MFRRDVILLHVVVQLLLAMCACVDGGASAPDSPFRLKRVSKTNIGGTYRIRLDYESSCDPAVMMRPSYSSLPQLLEHQSQGVTDFTVADSLKFLMLTYSCSDSAHYYRATLQLDGTPDVMDIPDIDVRFAQESDVTFAPGSRVKLDFTYDISGDAEFISSDAGVQGMLVIRSEGEHSLAQYWSPPAEAGDAPVWLQLVALQGDKGHRQGSILINSTLPDPEGLVEIGMSAEFSCDQNCLLAAFYTVSVFRFHREDHAGPFPDDFIGFITNQDLPHQDPDHPSNVYCYPPSRIGEDVAPCRINCQAEGSVPSTMSLTRVTQRGVFPVEGAFTMSLGNSSTAQARIDDVTADDAGVYRCTADVAADGRSITMDLTLVVVAPPANVSYVPAV